MEADSKEVLREEAQEVTQAMSSQHQELLEALSAAEAESTSLREALRVSLTEGRRRDGLVMANRQLESARHFDRSQLDLELKRLQVWGGRERYEGVG